MSQATRRSTYAFVDFRNRLSSRNEHRLSSRNEKGQATAEYGVVLLVAVALGMAVLMMFTGGVFNGILGGVLKKVLQVATGMIHP